MHPDAILKALRRELERLDKTADDFADRAKSIEAEIEANLKLDRPTVAAEGQATTVDHEAVYLVGLKQELERAEPERHAEIKAEIARVEKLIGNRKETTVDEKPSAEEVEQRKQARTGRKVERATAAPGEQRGDEQDEKSE